MSHKRLAHYGPENPTLGARGEMVLREESVPSGLTAGLGEKQANRANCTACGAESASTRLRCRKGDRHGRYCSRCL